MVPEHFTPLPFRGGLRRGSIPHSIRHLVEKREENGRLFRQERGSVQTEQSEVRLSSFRKRLPFLASEREPVILLFA